MNNTQSKDDEPPSMTEAVQGNEVKDGNTALVANASPDLEASFLKKIKHKTSKLFGLRSKSLDEDVADLIEEHDPEGTQVSSEERTLLHNVLNLGDVTVNDVMIPRTDIIAVDSTISLSQLRQIVIEKEHTRIPVFKETLDNVIGFLHIKDILPILGSQKKFAMDSVIREVLYVPPSMKIIDLLVKMRDKRVHIAIVLDEYGGTEGLLTMEDIMEEIVGEIEDEHDDVEESDLVVIDDNTYQVNARMHVSELEEQLDLQLINNREEEDFDTVGGLIFFMLGRVPEVGEVVTHSSGTTFEITDADPRHIKRVLLKKPQ